MNVVPPTSHSVLRRFRFAALVLACVCALTLTRIDAPSDAMSSQKLQDVVPLSSTGTTALFTLQGSGAQLSFGDYVSESLNTSYKYFVEVPPGLSRLAVEVFDADIGLGGATEDTAGRDRDRGGYDTSVTYSLFDPNGLQRTTQFTSGDAASPVGSDNAWLTLFDATGDAARDNFAAAAYNNSDGVLPWATNWIETNDDGNAAAGEILITGGRLRIEDNGAGGASTIERQVNLAAFTSATFTFDFETQNVEAGDQMRVEVSNNGGGSWTILETFTGPFAASSRNYNITTSIASNTRIRFIQGTGYTGTDRFFVDNLAVTGGPVMAGHWEVRVDMSTPVTTGDDINAFGLRAHDGTAGAGGTEVKMYVDSINGLGANPPAAGTTSRNYTLYPYITSGCACAKNDFDLDSNSGNVGSMSFTSRTGTFTQNFASATLSVDNVWSRGNISGWTNDRVADGYGIWQALLTVNSYLVGGTPNGNYANFYMSNFQAAANPPTANPTTNAFRVYLPTDAGGPPTKVFVDQRAINVFGPNPPAVGQPFLVDVIITVTNPTPNAVTFNASNLVTANVPVPGVVYAGNAAFTQGSLVSQPAVGGTGNVTWNPGVVAAGIHATLSYRVLVTLTAAGQRLPVTGTPASGNGTRAQYIDETGNTTQARARYTFGPLCELAVTAGIPTAAPATISGVITANNGSPLGGVTVSLSGDRTERTITDANGAYRFDNIDTDAFYSVTPARANFSFTPAQRSFSLVGNHTNVVFTGQPGNDIANPLDEDGFFVRQHYLDFLGREPEQLGWRYWSDEIRSCGFDAGCLQARRVGVSAAFFFSDEFQHKGSFVYRLYRAGLGRRLSFAEFNSASDQIVEGENREASKAAFTRAFVIQPEFLAKYQDALTGEGFVDALIDIMRDTSGVELSNQRSVLIGAYNQASDRNESRSLAIRHAVENIAFVQSEFNRAFVLMQYFGYLRRDADAGGYDFWLNVLENREQNNYRGMVCAFITSAEYQQRFSAAVTRTNAECVR